MEQVEKMSTSQLIAEQHEDSEVPLIFSRSVSETQVSHNLTCYFTKNGVLMKMWRPPDVPTEEEWALHYQMIVPKTYRPDVLSTADETPLPGHPGVNKTCQKILDHFYWLSLRKVVALVGLSSSIQSDQGPNVVWHISTRHARAWSHTIYVNRMSPSKSKISRKMTPNTEEHDEDLQFRNGGRLGRG